MLDDEARLSSPGAVATAGRALLAGLISSLCCVPAALAFGVGLGGSSTLVGLTRYRPFFVAAGVAFALLTVVWTLRRSRRCCSPARFRRDRVLIPAIVLGAFGASYVLINYVVLPWLYAVG